MNETSTADPNTGTVVAADRDRAQLEQDLEGFRRELTGYCYRMLASSAEAEDAVQETMVRAWRALDRFEGRSSLRTWLYRIATNVCLDALDGRQRRERPVDLGPASTVATAKLSTRPDDVWVEPAPDGRVLPSTGDPADLAVERETVRLAFVAALQHLPPRQRAVLVLREVLRWQASEVATLLDTTVASVNSALQRARATLATTDVQEREQTPLDDEHRALLARYVDAFARYDVDELVTLLHEDATMSMPPYELWLQGPQEIAGWLLGPGAECRGSHVEVVAANGTVAYGQYRPSGPGGAFEPWSLTVVQASGGRVTDLVAFLDVDRLFPLFGLPAVPDAPA
ncbi:sigma-70 family RNA polymerase sigma factor [Nitriliruptoraceae bacterium ZYF776]|nr:sigma-70 family RNA polymerase sigma factor [Profundirhabdus halotolerans]